MAISLQTLSNDLTDAVANPENTLQTTLAGLGDGSTMTVSQMVGLQYDMSVYSVTASSVSGVMKDISDTLKGIVQKIG